MAKIARLEKEGQIAFTDGTRTKKVPSEAGCRERLIKLLEEASGDLEHACVKQFWFDRAKDIGVLDELDSDWARACFDRLDRIWEELASQSAPRVCDDCERSRQSLKDFVEGRTRGMICGPKTPEQREKAIEALRHQSAKRNNCGNPKCVEREPAPLEQDVFAAFGV